MADLSLAIWLGVALLPCVSLSPVSAGDGRADSHSLHQTFMPEMAYYRNTLKELGVRSDADSLSGFLKSATKSPTKKERQRFKKLVAQLGADDFKSREQADKALRAIARHFIPEIRHLAKNSGDPEVRIRAAGILKAAQPEGNPKSVAAMQVIASDKVYGTPAAVLAALAANGHPAVQRAAERALIATIRTDDVPLLLASLAADKPAHVRCVCIRVLSIVRPKESRKPIASLLASKNSRIRLEAAVALARQGDRSAVDPLIELLSSQELDVRHRAGTTLAEWFDRDNGFRAYGKADDRAAAIARWRKWAKSAVTSAKPLPRFRLPSKRGRVLVVHGTTLLELGPDGRVIHKQVGFKFLSEAIAIRNGNRLVTDFMGWTLFEYDMNWKQVRRTRLPFQPRGAHRLPGGRTLVIGMHQFSVLGRTGKTTSVVNVGMQSNMTGSLLLPGNRFLVTNNDTGSIVEMDISGRIIWQMHVGNAPRSVQILDDGRLLVADFHQAAIYTPDGKSVWRYPLEGVRSAEQLRSGNILLAHRKGLTLIDRGGNVLWQMAEPEIRGVGFYAKTH